MKDENRKNSHKIQKSLFFWCNVLFYYDFFLFFAMQLQFFCVFSATNINWKFFAFSLLASHNLKKKFTERLEFFCFVLYFLLEIFQNLWRIFLLFCFRVEKKKWIFCCVQLKKMYVASFLVIFQFFLVLL